jgi:hypothetical protein
VAQSSPQTAPICAYTINNNETQMTLTATNFDHINLSDVLEENTEMLQNRVSGDNKWLNADGTPKKNYIWKVAPKTPQGDQGESVVATSLRIIFAEVYGPDVQCNVVNKGKGEFDVRLTLPDGTVYTFEVKTATEDVNGCHQFNGLRKDVNYDYAFLFGVAPEEFYFDIVSHDYLCETMTTNMSKDVVGSYKYTVRQDNLKLMTTQNLVKVLQSKGML